MIEEPTEVESELWALIKQTAHSIFVYMTCDAGDDDNADEDWIAGQLSGLVMTAKGLAKKG